MILRSVLRLSAAAMLGACAAAPASAQIFSQGTPQIAPPAAPQSVPRAVPRSAPQSVPMPRPRPPQMTVAPAAVQPVPAPLAAEPARMAAPAEPAPAAVPVPPAVAVAEPMTPAQTGAAPSPSTSDDTPADATSTAALTPSDTGTPAEPGAPLDLAQPQPLPPPSDIQPAPELAAADRDQPADKKTLGKVNSYFNGISTLVGNFTQIGPDGSRADGKFFLVKPGKVRFYYQRPSTTDIIADGKSLVVRDRKLATQDVYPLSQTPLKFLLDKNLDLARDSKVIAVYEEPGLVSVALEEETTFGGKARILIVFGTEDGKKYELKQWTITDPQGLNTTVSLSELDTATKPDDKLFAVDYSRDIRRN